MKRTMLSILAALVAFAMQGQEKISWDKTVHDFGNVCTADGPLECAFSVSNNSTEPVTILEVVSSCGCTNVQWSREAIQPGERGTIKATYKNEDGPIPFDKTLTVYITGVKKPVVLRLRGVVHEKKKSLSQLYGAQRLGDFGMASRSLKAPTLRQGLSVSETVTVANLGRKPLQVEWTGVHPLLSLKLSRNPIPAGETATLSYTIQSDRAFFGKQVYAARPVLNGKTADGRIEITAWTQENFADWTEAEKKDAALPYFDQSTFTFGSVPSGTVVEATFPCANRGRKFFHVYKADADVAIKAETPDIGPQSKKTYRFTLDTSQLPKGETVLMVSLTTNSPLRPLINLFITGVVE